ncbi:MAG: cation:proton antiporter [Gemmatimonadales bacterium]
MPEEPVLTLVVATVGLLLVAAMAAIGLRRLNLPFTVGLVVIGMALGCLTGRVEALEPLGGITLSPELILFVFLPTLIFESAYNLDGRLLAKNMTPVLVLAVPGLLITTAIVGVLTFFLTPLSWGPALLFGALIAATDPVAVVALFKEVGAPKRLAILVEGESLLNDATAIVVFRILMGVVVAGTFGVATIGSGIADFVIVFAGGILVGGTIGYLMVASLRLADNDPLVEVTLSTVVAYAAFLLADHYLHVSGVMATLGAGLVISTYGSTRFTEETKSYLHRFWEYAAFVANSLIFLLVGMSVSLDLISRYLVPIGSIILVVLFARAVTVYGTAPAIARIPGSEPISWEYRTVLFWGGLKGAVGLALAMSLPAGFPGRDLIVTLTLGVVLFTLVAGGLSTGPLIRALGLARPSLVARVARAQAWLAAKTQALDRLENLASAGHYSAHILNQLRTEYDNQIDEARGELTHLHRECEASPNVMLHVLWAEALTVERSTYRDLFDRGVISEPVLRELELSVDLQRDNLERGNLPASIPSVPPIEVRIESTIVGMVGWLAPRSRFVERNRRRALAAKYEHQAAILAASERVVTQLEQLAGLSGADPAVEAQCRSAFEERTSTTMGRLDTIAEHFPEYVQAVQTQTVRRIVLDAEADAIESLAAVGGIPGAVAEAARSGVELAQRELARQPLSALESSPEELLRRVPMFQELGEADLRKVAAQLVPRTALAGESVIRQGERGTSLFLIARGVVAVLICRNGEPPVRVASLHAGEFFGEMALLTDEPRSATVTAATDCRLFELSKRDVEALCHSSTGVTEALERAATARAAPADMA